MPATDKMDKKIFSNRSKYECTWIAGPTHEIRM